MCRMFGGSWHRSLHTISPKTEACREPAGTRYHDNGECLHAAARDKAGERSRAAGTRQPSGVRIRDRLPSTSH
jgi:hypothetical protein